MTMSARAQLKRQQRAASPAARLMQDFQHWMGPARDHEVALFAEIQALPSVMASIVRVEGTEFGDCHANCYRFCQDHPNNEIIHGWVLDSFARAVVHSVIRNKTTGRYYCISPHIMSREELPFTPDAEIVVDWAGGPTTRRGIAIAPGVRSNPAQFIHDVRAIKRSMRHVG